MLLTCDIIHENETMEENRNTELHNPHKIAILYNNSLSRVRLGPDLSG